jgi:hypothetical protein
MQCALTAPTHVSLTTLDSVSDANVNIISPKIRDVIWRKPPHSGMGLN